MAFPFIFGDYSAIHKRIVFSKRNEPNESGHNNIVQKKLEIIRSEFWKKLIKKQIRS